MDLRIATEKTLNYRLALPSDRWALAWIEARSFGWGRLLGGQWLALDGRRVGGWLACDVSGRVLGYALVDRRKGRPYVPGIGVLPDWRRRGIGEQLIRLVLGAHRDVWLHAREGNTAARRLYARLGLRETRRMEHFYTDGEAAVVIEAVDEPTIPSRWAVVSLSGINSRDKHPRAKRGDACLAPHFEDDFQRRRV